jgi:hypothetical protein
MRKFMRSSWMATLCGFVMVFVLVEAITSQVRAGLPVAPGKWPRTEIAQKLDRMDRAISRGHRFDVVFAGSSVMAGGVDPVAFTKASGESSYNAAWAGATARTSVLWLRDVIEPLAAPKVVVLGLQSGELNDNAPKSTRTYRKFVKAPGYKQMTSLLRRQPERWLEKVSNFFRYRIAFRSPANLFRKDRAALKDAWARKTIGPRGIRDEEPTGYHFRDKFRRKFYDNNLVNLSFGGKEYRAVARLNRQFARLGVKLIFMATPVTADYYSIHDSPQRDRARYRSLVERFHKETGGTVIDAADAFPTSTPFRDPIHLDIDARAELAEALAEKWPKISTACKEWFKVKCKGNADPECRVNAR